MIEGEQNQFPGQEKVLEAREATVSNFKIKPRVLSNTAMHMRQLQRVNSTTSCPCRVPSHPKTQPPAQEFSKMGLLNQADLYQYGY